MIDELAGISDVDQAANTENRVKNRNEMTRKDFFEIMTLQLQQQDPMSPMESENFLNQLVSMQSLDTMNTLTDSLASFVDNQAFTTASSVLGKRVVTSGANAVQGYVDQVVRDGNEVTIKVALEHEQMSIAALLGKDVLAKNDAGNFITGSVKDIIQKDGQTHLMLTDGLAGSDDVFVPYDSDHVIKVTVKVKFDDITEIGEPVDLGELDN
jgi:hypothetical protein